MKMSLNLCAWVMALASVLGSAAVTAHAAGNAETGKAKAAACAACHGVDGNGGADPTWPKLAAQDPDYLVKQMMDFKSGARKDPIMQGMAAPLSKQDMADIAAYYASQPVKTGMAKNAELAKKGARLYRGGNAATGVSACMSCHGPSGHGIPPRFPRVSSQSAAYTEKQLLAFKSTRRTNDAEFMTRIAFRMSEAEIEAVAQYMAGLH